MALIPFHNLGLVGIIKDLSPYELPPEAWSDGLNIRFQDNKIQRGLGHVQQHGTLDLPPYATLEVPTDVALYTMYMGLDNVSVVAAGVHTDITRASGVYTGGIIIPWTGGLLNGLPVINNGVDDPQMWNPAATGTLLTPLTAWPANTKCRAIRPFKTFLMALDVTLSGVRDNKKVKWSHTADPGTIPTTWDISDTTKDAGEFSLADSRGAVLDCLPLRDLNVIYKEDETWLQQFIGGAFIFKFERAFSELGMLTSRCVGPFTTSAGAQHFVATSDDVVVHNGVQAKSIIDRKCRRFIFNQLDTDNYTNSYVVANFPEREMWFCFPKAGETFPSQALIYNVITESLSLRDLGPSAGAPFISVGRQDPENTTIIWDAASQDVPWDDLPDEHWDIGVTAGARRQLLMSDHTNSKLFVIDSSNQYDGANYTSYVERTGLAIVGQDRQGNPKMDFEKRKFCSRIWIKASGDPFQVQVGGQEHPEGAVTYASAKTFTPGTTKYLDFTENHRLMAVRFESTDNAHWEIDSYDLELTLAGKF